jgi:hypothetical protein
MAKKQKGYVYDVYDESYYRYKAEKDKLRSQYPEEMIREEWRDYYKKVMDLIDTSPDWQQWVWDNPLPYEGVYNQTKIKESDEKKERRFRKSNYPYFVLFIDDVRTDRQWNNLRVAETELGLSDYTISAILNGHRKKTHQGYTFKFKKDLE